MAIRVTAFETFQKFINSYFLFNSRRTCRIDAAASSRMLHEKVCLGMDSPSPRCRIGLLNRYYMIIANQVIQQLTLTSTKNFGMY